MEAFNMGHAHHIQSDVKEKQIWLWHQHLGHQNFGYLKHLIPDLFFNMVISDFQCDTCILVKNHRTFYPLSMNKSTIPFALIHSYVWGPSPISIGFVVRWFVIFVYDFTHMT